MLCAGAEPRAARPAVLTLSLSYKYRGYLRPGRTGWAWAARARPPAAATGSAATAPRSTPPLSLARTSSCAAPTPRRSPSFRRVFVSFRHARAQPVTLYGNIVVSDKNKNNPNNPRPSQRKRKVTAVRRGRPLPVESYGSDPNFFVRSGAFRENLNLLSSYRRTPVDWAGSMWHSRISHQSAMPTSCLPSHRLGIPRWNRRGGRASGSQVQMLTE